MSARLDGDKKLNKAFDRHVQKLERKTNEALKSGGMMIQNDAFKRSPYLTGNLRSSLNTEIEGSGDKKQAIIGTNVSYAPHLEYGTSKMSARPYLRPAFDSKKRAAEQEIKTALDIVLRKW